MEAEIVYISLSDILKKAGLEPFPKMCPFDEEAGEKIAEAMEKIIFPRIDPEKDTIFGVQDERPFWIDKFIEKGRAKAYQHLFNPKEYEEDWGSPC